MHTVHIVEIEITNNRRKGSASKRTGVRALIRSADILDGPYGVVLFPTVNGRLDETRPEVLPGCFDDLADADKAAREALQARKRSGS